MPTGAEAERLVRDLGQFLGEGEVELFPAWETLPFERVSPSFETMGRRLRVMWRLRSGTPPAVVVAPVVRVGYPHYYGRPYYGYGRPYYAPPHHHHHW